jgi:hypothetical protein
MTGLKGFSAESHLTEPSPDWESSVKECDGMNDPLASPGMDFEIML